MVPDTALSATAFVPLSAQGGADPIETWPEVYERALETGPQHR